MNFKSQDFIVAGISENFKRFVEQYLENSLSDEEFRSASLSVIDDIINTKLELETVLKELMEIINKSKLIS